MPWTRRAVKFLLSDSSPLTGKQRTKMLGELHANPAMGHAKKKHSGFQSVAKAVAKKK